MKTSFHFVKYSVFSFHIKLTLKNKTVLLLSLFETDKNVLCDKILTKKKNSYKMFNFIFDIRKCLSLLKCLNRF
jgi:hypothetical protein